MARGARRAFEVASVAASANALPAVSAVVPRLAAPLGIERTSGGEEVWLTFDDGPHPAGTPAVLERLAEAKTRALFFLVGEQVLRHPAVVAEIVAAGHAIGLHCHRHRFLLRLPPRAVASDLAHARAVIAEAAGRDVAFYRPPYGAISAAALLAARRQGLRPLLWSRHGADWTIAATPASIVRRVTATMRPGDVVLLHDSDSYTRGSAWRKTAQALPDIIAALRRRGLRASLPGDGRAQR